MYVYFRLCCDNSKVGNFETQKNTSTILSFMTKSNHSFDCSQGPHKVCKPDFQFYTGVPRVKVTTSGECSLC